MEITTDPHPDIEPTEDKVHRLVRVALSAVPIAGGAAVELFNTLIMPPVEKRREKWIKEVSVAIAHLLNEKRVTWDQLINNDLFFSTLVHASAEALKNHQSEKLAALRAAVINSALGSGLADDEEAMFLNLVGALTPSHIIVLRLFLYPQQHLDRLGAFRKAKRSDESVGDLLSKTFSETNGDRNFWQLVFQDLQRLGLMNTQKSISYALGGIHYPGGVTSIAAKFVRFISANET